MTLPTIVFLPKSMLEPTVSSKDRRICEGYVQVNLKRHLSCKSIKYQLFFKWAMLLWCSRCTDFEL